MTDTQAAATKRRVKKVFDLWLPIMGLENWKITLKWQREYWEDDDHTQARTRPMWQYLAAEIHFYLPALHDETDEEIVDVVVHELAHCLVDPMNNSKGDREKVEFATESVACAVKRAYAAKKT